MSLPHVHTEACRPGCTRVEDLEIDTRTLTGILDLRDLHAEIHRRNRRPRAGDGRWWRKLMLRIVERALILLLALLALVLARLFGVADLLLALLKGVSS